MSQQPQLDLGVVGIHQQVPRRRHEHPAHLAAQLRAGGDVLEVGLRGGQAAGGRYRHLEAGADAAVGVDDLQQAVGIGAFQFAVLPVLQHVRHNGVLPAELFQHVGVGGPAGFGFLAVGQLEILKEHLAQLLGGVDVEGSPGGVIDPLLQPADGAGKALTEVRQCLGVHQKAPLLHPGQHRAERQFHGVIQLLHAQLLQLGGQGLIQGLHGGAVAVEGRPRRSGIRQRGKGIRLQMQGLGQFFIIVGHEQPLEVVASGGGIQQIGGQRRIEPIALYGEVLLQQRPHGVLDVVAHLADIGGEQGRQQRTPRAGVAALIQLRCGGGVRSGIPLDGEDGEVR